nr:hypothetical protein [Asanoa siamensis]
MTDTTMAVDSSAVAKRIDPAAVPADGVDAELAGRPVEQAPAAGLQLTGGGGLLQQLTVVSPADGAKPFSGLNRPCSTS